MLDLAYEIETITCFASFPKIQIFKVAAFLRNLLRKLGRVGDLKLLYELYYSLILASCPKTKLTLSNMVCTNITLLVVEIATKNGLFIKLGVGAGVGAFL